MSNALRIQVIVGSVRQKRFCEKPARYLFDELAKRPDVEAELVDLRDWPLPFYDQPVPPAANKGNFGHEIAARWAAKVGEADGYVIVSPEYNHGYPGLMKHVLDTNLKEYIHKAAGVVGVSAGIFGGARMIQNLIPVLRELGLVPIFWDVNFTTVRSRFDGVDVDARFARAGAPVVR